jgi:hypothetical protein
MQALDFQGELRSMEKLFKASGPGNSSVGLEAGAKLLQEYSEKIASAQVHNTLVIDYITYTADQCAVQGLVETV